MTVQPLSSRLHPAAPPPVSTARLRRPLAGLILLALGSPPPALAEEAGADAAVLEAVTVTARKVAEDIQQAPLAVTARSAADLEDAHVQATRELARQVPNFSYADSGLPFANLLNIRGIGSSSALISPSVIYYVDGLPVPTRIFDQRFAGASRVEVLRGPQGTLFGLNAQAGVVNIVTAEPSDQPERQIGIEFGSHGRRQLDASISGPLSETVSARLSGQLYGYDGDLRNYRFDAAGQVVDRDREVRAETLGSLSGKLVAAPGGGTRVTLSGNYRNDRQRPTTGIWLDDPGFPRAAVNPVPTSHIRNSGLGLKIEHDLGWARLTSLTGAQRYDIDMKADLVDGFLGSAQTGFPPYFSQAAGVNVRRIDEHDTQFTQELRLDGESAGGSLWVLGLSALYGDFESTTDITSLQLANGAYTGKVRTTNLAAFGEATVPITAGLRWIAGLRASHERQDFDGRFRGRNGALPRFDEGGDRRYGFTTGRTGFSYDLADTATAFATVSRGEKTGGYLYYNQFAAAGIAQAPYENAETWSYEAGLKGSLFERRLSYAATVFHSDTRNEQLFTYNPSLGRASVQNADTRSQGAEFELNARATRQLTLGANLAFLDAEIRGGANASLKGNSVPYAPAFSAGVSAEYRWWLSLGNLPGSAFGRVEYHYVGSRQIDPANSRRLGDYELVNLRAGWQTERLDVYLYVENLFDAEYVSSAFQAGTSTSGRAIFAGTPGTARNLGVGARLRF